MLKFLTDGGIARVLHHRQYRRYVAGDSISLLGDWIQRVAIGWLTWELTGSGLWLGIIAMAELFPSVLAAPLGGALADKLDRRKMALVSEYILLIQASTLAALTWFGIIDIAFLVALTLLRGFVNAGSHPARQSLVPSLVPRAELSSAVALNSLLFNIARFIGPAIAGVVIATFGIAYAFIINALSFLIFILALSVIRPPFTEEFVRKPQSLFAQLDEVVRYIARHPGIGPMMVLLLATSFLVRPVTDLLPGYAGAVFDSGVTGLAWMTSAMGLGSIIAAFRIAQRGKIDGLTGIAVGNAGVMALAALLFALAPQFWMALILLVVTSYAITLTGVGAQALIQTSVSGELRGRVVSVYGMIFRAAPASGALIIGALSELFGWQWPLAISAALCLIVWLWGRSRLTRMSAMLESQPPERGKAP